MRACAAVPLLSLRILYLAFCGACGDLVLIKGPVFFFKRVGVPSHYPESSWKIFWFVLALLGWDLDDLWRK